MHDDMRPIFEDALSKGQADWSRLVNLFEPLRLLDTCPQDPRHHGEGDVGTHTRMVIQELLEDAEFLRLDADAQFILFYTAVLHDIGKPERTVHEDDGSITSRGHSRTGSHIARSLMRQFLVPFKTREAICNIITLHQTPFWLYQRPDAGRVAIKASLATRPAHLLMHALADARGRIADDRDSIIDNVALSGVVFDEHGILDQPYPFANDESRVAYFEKEDRDPSYAAHDDPGSTVTVMCALPGSGKDHWIANNGRDRAVVSLDDIRKTIKVSATDNQGRVIQEAQEMARIHLRKGDDFIWNATNISSDMRGRIIRLCRDYRARIEIVYIETDPATLLKQNRDRSAPVPESVLDGLVRKLEPPMPWEAHSITHCLHSSLQVTPTTSQRMVDGQERKP